MREIDMSRHTVVFEVPAEPVDLRVQMTEKQIAENFRRANAYPMLVTVHPDGTTSFKEDRVHHGDGIKDTVGADRGEGSKDSIKLLRAEGNVPVDGLLPREPADGGPRRDASGKFVSKDDA
jgi:hypothetical protein